MRRLRGLSSNPEEASRTEKLCTKTVALRLKGGQGGEGCWGNRDGAGYVPGTSGGGIGT